MADGDGAAIDVELGLVEAELARAGHDLGAERLVDLEAVDVGELEPGALQHRLDRRHRADAHDLRRHADRGAGDDARERRLAGLLRVVGRTPTSAAAAPSTMAEELPPVCTPPKAGRIFASASSGEGADVGVGGELLLALELEAARLVVRRARSSRSSPA